MCSILVDLCSLWIWGSPVKITQGAEEISVIFLDTEGFYASNVSESKLVITHVLTCIQSIRR